jgi:hypothetical protein
MREVPAVLRDYWARYTWDGIQTLRTAVVIVMRQDGHDTYLKRVGEAGVAHQRVFSTTAMPRSGRRHTPFSILEEDSTGQITRLFVEHPEGYGPSWAV